MSSYRILLVDDNETSLKLLKAIFEDEYEVITASDGLEGFEALLLHDNIRLVISDILMPNMDGYHLCYKIRTTSKIKNIPVIIYTATYASQSEQQVAMDMGATLYLRKPAPVKVLSNSVKDIIAAPHNYPHKTPNKPESDQLMRQYSEKLVTKLEQSNAELEAIKSKLEHSEYRLKKAQEIALLGSWEVDLTTNIATWSDETCRIFGLPITENIHVGSTFLTFVHPDDRPAITKEVTASNAAFKDNSFSTRIISKDGVEKYVNVERRFEFDQNNRAKCLYGIIHDVTEQKRAEQKILKANRLYAFISAINQSIVHINNAQELFDQICGIALEIGGFQSAGIGLFDREGKLDILSVLGDDTVKVTLQKRSGLDYRNSELRDSVTGWMLSTGKYAYTNDALLGDKLLPWKADFLLLGVRGIISLPIKKGEQIIGVFSLSTTIENFFDEQEINLLEEATNDISFALANFEKEKMRRQAEENLAREELRLEQAQAIAHLGSWQVDLSTGLSVWSDETCRIFGYPVKENVQTPRAFYELIHPDDLDIAMKAIKESNAEHADCTLEHRIIRRDGGIRHVRTERRFEMDENGKAKFLYGITHDITDRKNAEELLKQNEAKLKDAQAIAHVGSWELDLVNHTLNWSDEHYAILELERGKVVPTQELFFSLVHPDDLELLKNAIALSTESRKNASVNFRLKLNTNPIKYVFAEWKFDFDALGHPVRRYGILQDITYKKLAEFQRDFDKSNLDALINNIKDLMWSVDRDYNLITFNQPLQDILKPYIGMDLEPGMNMLAFAQTKEQERLYKIYYERAFNGESFTELEYNPAPADSWAEISFHPIKEGDKIIGSACHSRNVTERKKAEQELKRVQERLFFHLENSPLGYFEWDSNYNIKSLSKQAEDIFGYNIEEIKAHEKNRYNFVHPEDQPEGAQIAQQLLTGKLEQATFQNRSYRKDGRLIWVEWFTSVKKDADGKVETIMSLVQDITERKMAEDKVIELNETLEERVQQRTVELTEANKALEAFSSTVSHDLRAPVRAVNGFSTIILNEHNSELSNEVREIFGYILESGKRMGDIIDDLLKLARSGKEHLRLEPVDMTSMVNGVWQNISRTSPHRATLELAPLPEMKVDMSMMQQVIVNLLSNAIKYSSKVQEPVVKIWGEEADGQVTFYFKDNGAGFDMKHYDRLFGAFQRLHGPQDFEGTGVGLALVKRIIEKHGGTIAAKAAPGEGATFYFTIPQYHE